MKLAQFKTKTGNTGRLGLLAGERVIELAALADAVKQAGGEVSAWLLEVADMLGVIGRGEPALAEINALVEDAQIRGVAGEERLAFALDEIEFLPAVYAGKILAIGRNYEDHAVEG